MPRKETYISRQAKRLSTGQIDRRRFVMSALATGVTLPTAMSLASRAEASAPRPGGHLRFGLASGSSTDRLDPLRADTQMLAAINLARGSTLAELAPGNRVRGELATEIEASPDGRTWRFTLAPEATFHDGQPVRASDVVATLHYHQVRSGRHATSGIVSQIERIETDGLHRVTLHLGQPNWGFAHLLADHRMIILPATEGGIDPDTIIGSGPYLIDTFVPGERAELVRRTDHWCDNTGHFERITILAIPDPTARQGAILNNEVDVIDQVDPRAIGLIEKMPGIRVRDAEGTSHVTLSLPTANKTFTRPAFRQAIRHLLPRQELLDKVFLGHGAIGGDAPVKSRFQLEPVAHDPDTGRALLRTLGNLGPIPLAVETSSTGLTDVARLIASQLAGAGLTVHFGEQPTSDTMRLSLSPGRATDDWLYATSYMPEAGCCETGWNLTEEGTAFGAIIRNARAIHDQKDRDRQFSLGAGFLATSGTSMVPLFVNDIHAHAEKLTWTDGDHVQSQASAARIARYGWFKKV